MAPDANWYPDPEGPGLRWWDGSAWTDHRKEAPAPPSVVTDAPTEPNTSPADIAESPAGEGGRVEPNADPGLPPSSAPAWPPQPDEQSFAERAAEEPARTPPAPTITGTDPASQEMYRRMAADPGMSTRRAEIPPPAHSRVFREAEAEVAARQRAQPMSGGAKVAMVVILIFIVGIIASIFHIGGSENSSNAPVPRPAESYEEQYEAAHDAVCEHAPWKYEPECQ